MKIYSNRPADMTSMATMPIYGKNLQKSYFPTAIGQWSSSLIYVAFVTRVLLRLNKYYLGFTLTFIMAISDMGKCSYIRFHGKF